MQAGQTNTLLDVAGLRVGQAHDVAVKTGVSIIVPARPALCSVDVRGGGPGTREISALQDGGLIDRVHGISLSGGSVYGLGAADRLTALLGARRQGYVASQTMDVPVSPIVPSAILFDNANGGDKNWGDHPPYGDLAEAAFAALDAPLSLGRAGAGFGATAGLYAGGMGSASEIVGDVTIGALIAANPIGSPYMPGTDCPWAWAYEMDGEFGARRPPKDFIFSPANDTKLETVKHGGQSTVIGVVAVNAALSQKQLKRLAIMAQDGISMAVQPSHTPLDGDTIFALSMGDVPCEGPVHMSRLGAAAARVVARALMRGVYEASL